MTKPSSGEPERPRQKAQYPRRDQFTVRPDPDPVATGEAVVLTEVGPWKRKVDAFLDARENERRRERDIWMPRDHCKCEDRRPMPRPFLDCSSNFGPQISALRAREVGTVSFPVWNGGIYPAWTCYVELYEGPSGYTSPLSAYELRGRRIITLHPGERRDVPLAWVRRQRTGRIVGIVFDPLLDPHGLDLVVQVDRHITSVHYMNLE